ncbi:ABC transporter permease [Janibacter alkaliphilus]|uniref:Simple sugar transport system permease protein n=1 Tax=Janibacter alkaliphilus TaxID=1069963 RepID=A0A852WYL5_9MICO|nr:ABC transporter permease [Janibacter alkaliphilus]NYG35699.1 simple sugar transport system permease protein [Janibacter alkaliphilus]
MTLNLRRLGLTLAAPALAIVVAFIITSLVLVAVGDPVGLVWQTLLTEPRPRTMVNIVNSAVTYYIAAVAVAIGFKMKLFNIGVDGQYRIATFAAALVAGHAWLPGPLNVILALLVAMAVGAVWAGIAGWLKVTRGVSEVISTIMLNTISAGLVAWGLRSWGSRAEGSNARSTTEIPESSQLDGLALVPDTPVRVYTLLLLAVVVGLAYWFVINKTRFGFDLRATGESETAAVASGVKVKRMVLIAMLASGAVAGLIGMPAFFGLDHAYGANFQDGVGFVGIGVALLGRNHPVGIAFAALLWSWLEKASDGLQLQADVSPALVYIIQGTILLAVVVAYEVVRRIEQRMEQRQVAAELDAPAATEGASA